MSRHCSNDCYPEKVPLGSLVPNQLLPGEPMQGDVGIWGDLGVCTINSYGDLF